MFMPTGCTIKDWISGKAGAVMLDTQDFTLIKILMYGQVSAKMII
jgi:hypothetical protein